MMHRHLTHEEFTSAAIADVIERGKRADWAKLRGAMLADASVRDRILRVCEVRVADAYAQRHHFWKHYAEHANSA